MKVEVPDAFNHPEPRWSGEDAKPEHSTAPPKPGPLMAQPPFAVRGLRIWVSYNGEKKNLRAHIVGGVKVSDDGLAKASEFKNGGSWLSAAFFFRFRKECVALLGAATRHMFSAAKGEDGASQGVRFLGAVGMFVEVSDRPSSISELPWPRPQVELGFDLADRALLGLMRCRNIRITLIIPLKGLKGISTIASAHTTVLFPSRSPWSLTRSTTPR